VTGAAREAKGEGGGGGRKIGVLECVRRRRAKGDSVSDDKVLLSADFGKSEGRREGWSTSDESDE
jgi:hypothetical protein